MKKMTIKLIDEKTAVVTKSFMKNAKIFGTDEYKLWKEFKKDCPEAVMTTKTIKKNPNKKTYKNMTYANMRIYIKHQSESETMLKEFEKQIEISSIYKNPYHHVLAWFIDKFQNIDEYFDDLTTENTDQPVQLYA